MDEKQAHTGKSSAESAPSTGVNPRSARVWATLDDFVEHHFSLIASLTLISLVLLAWHHRFIQDDAFISFRYAKNFIVGKGLVWNAGEHVEGYTNFFWTLLIGLGMFFGIDPVIWSELLGLGCFVVTLFATYGIAHRVFGRKSAGLLAVLLLGTNYTFICYATGGLETQLQAMLCTSAAFLMLRIERESMPALSILVLSITLAVAILTRLDSSIFCFIFFASTLAILLKKEPRKRLVITLALLGLPLLLIVGAWLTWKYAYYGDILPNTFYIKASSDTSLGRGLNFLYLFFKSYILWPFAFLFFFGGIQIVRTGHRLIPVMAGIILLWMIYIVKIGGDFMEFRFLVPILPFFFIILTWVLFTTLRNPIIRLAGILLIVFGSFLHAQNFKYTLDDRVEPIDDLSGHLYSPDKHWVLIGETLGKDLHYDSTVTVATTAAGAIPYYSSLRSVDMLGLNDPWIARFGVLISSVPGHQRIAPMEYLRQREVNLVVSHPQVLPLAAPVTQLPMLPGMTAEFSTHARVLEIPLDAQYKVVALYLLPHPTIDEAIARNGWTVHEISRTTGLK